MKKLIVIFSFVFSRIGICLEIDEKLTLRILDVSDTKRTILINRGLEDGLVVGDHAKLYLSADRCQAVVVARHLQAVPFGLFTV